MAEDTRSQVSTNIPPACPALDVSELCDIKVTFGLDDKLTTPARTVVSPLKIDQIIVGAWHSKASMTQLLATASATLQPGTAGSMSIHIDATRGDQVEFANYVWNAAIDSQLPGFQSQVWLDAVERLVSNRESLDKCFPGGIARWPRPKEWDEALLVTLEAQREQLSQEIVRAVC